MIICHLAPFAPNRCGLYEAARDMARADIEGGNRVIFIDAGITTNGVREEPKIGGVDNRGDFKLETASPAMINDADVIVLHTGVPDNWLVKCQAPLVWVIHGRPLACFRPELQSKGNSYSLYQNIAQWKRSKKMVYFWPEFKPHWDICIPESKQVVFEHPAVDSKRFNSFGEKYKLQNPGKYNILICDSSREDIDLYELVVGCIEAARDISGIKFHFFGFEHPIPNCWNIVLGKLKNLGCLGDICGRLGNMETIYRACDCLISPNRIATRTIIEALACGIPVIAQSPCKVANYTCDIAQPNQVADTIKKFIADFDARMNFETALTAELFDIKRFSEKMNNVYKEVTHQKEGD